MACSNNTKNSFYKSAQTAYNIATQATTATGTTLQILGTQACDTGCSLSTGTTGFTVLHGGLYRFSFDVIASMTTAGAVTLQLFNGTTALPCAVATTSIGDAGTGSLHVETVIRLGACCGVQPVISAQLSGGVASVTHVCASAVKLA